MTCLSEHRCHALLAATSVKITHVSGWAFDDAGWAAVGVTWAYVIVWWLLADVVKTLVQAVSRLFLASHNCQPAACRHKTPAAT